MITIDVLREAEADLAALAGLPGEIRAKVKAGLAELGRLRDEIDAAIAAMTGRATATLASLHAMASVEALAPGDAPPPNPEAPAASSTVDTRPPSPLGGFGA